jgi:HAD superfamily hydrolase (TIGR01509 family)
LDSVARAALFDAGDTLLHWNVHKQERFLWLCRQVGIDLPDDGEATKRAARAAERFYYQEFTRADSWTAGWWTDQAAAGLAELGLPRALAIKVQEHRDSLPNRFVLDPDALDVIRDLRARGFRIGLVSNWDGTLADTCVELGLSQYVDYVGDSTRFGEPKPSVAFFQHVLNQLDVKPDDAFHVGDHYDADVEGARATGITPILLDPFECEDRICDLRVRQLREVLGVVDELWGNRASEPKAQR